MASGNVSRALAAVLQRVAAAAPAGAERARLVAVSKTKPLEMVKEAYAAGHRHFGENYAQELMEKAPQMPADTKWHFIGQLQSNKCAPLVKRVPSLFAVETVGSAKVADKLNRAATAVEREEKLHVYVQVNTSAEEQKGGVEPEEAEALCRHILDECGQLHLAGLMTIGKLGEPGKKYFELLSTLRDTISESIGHPLGLSMGMSGDFEDAIACGATNVRVGSTIFGSRNYAK